MLSHNIAHHPSLWRLPWTPSPILGVNGQRLRVWCTWHQSRPPPVWIGGGGRDASRGPVCASPQSNRVVLTSSWGTHLRVFQPVGVHICSCEFRSIPSPCIPSPTGYILERRVLGICQLASSCIQILSLARTGKSFYVETHIFCVFCTQHTVPQYFWCGYVCCSRC